MQQNYMHGYQATESARLADQARTLEDLLHHDTHFAAVTRVLEVGCSVGAQMVALARHSPQAHITAVDIAPASLRLAQARTAAAGITPMCSFRAQACGRCLQSWAPTRAVSSNTCLCVLCLNTCAT